MRLQPAEREIAKRFGAKGVLADGVRVALRVIDRLESENPELLARLLGSDQESPK